MFWSKDIERLEVEIESLRDRLHGLAARVYKLEQDSLSAAPQALPVEPRIAAAPPIPVMATAAAPAAPPVEAAAPPEPAAPERVRISGAGEGPGWEAMVGGNWLNKVGVLVLVIGLALFLWYSFGRMGPRGRVATALAVSVVMLAGGVALERRENYRVAARGLIGGGWAALYSTVYAAHAVEAARVIASPAAATLLLAGVAGAMIAHSLRYRAQAVTGLSYFVGFVTLAISPLTSFVLIALAPLAISLSYLAQRFRWTTMALLGVPATYGIYMLHAARASGGSLAVGQSVLLVYWAVFELFDVLYAVSMRAGAGKPCAMFPLNAAGFLLVSAVQWQASSPEDLYLLFVLSAAAYLASALLRTALLPVASFDPGESPVARIRRGSYEGAIALAAALVAVALALKLSGLSISVAFLIEAELLFVAGLYYRQPFLGNIAAALLGISTARLIAADVPDAARFSFAGRVWHAWTPVALLHAGVFSVNRWLRQRATYYSHAAAALLLLVLAFELPGEFIGLGWLLLALALAEFGIRKRLGDYVLQSYGAGALSLLVLLGRNVVAEGIHTDWHGWLPQIGAALILYAAAARAAARREAGKQAMVLRSITISATILMAAFLRNVLAAPLATVAWALLSLVLVEAGYAARLPVLRSQGHILGALVVGRLFALHLDSAGANYGLSARCLTVLPVVALDYLMWWRATRWTGAGTARPWEPPVARLYSYSAAALAVILWGLESGRAVTAVGWGILGLLFLLAARRLGDFDFWIQSVLVAVLAAVRVWVVNLSLEGSFARLPERVTTTGAVILCLCGAAFLSKGWRRGSAKLVRLASEGRIFLSALATLLLFALLARQVSGPLLTVAWGVQGVVLLVAGFSLREPCLRLSGLALLLVCVGKLFGYDLRHLDMPFRIGSFLVLGVILIGVSLIYSQFRERISRYL